MQSTTPVYEEESEDTTINKTREITNLAFLGIETTGAPGNIFIYQTGRISVTSRRGKKMCLCYIGMTPT